MSSIAKPTSELQALLDAAVDAIVFIDYQGIIQVFSLAAERMFGYTAAEALGSNVTLLMIEPERTQHHAYLERYRRTDIPHIIGVGREVQARRKDGSCFPAFLSVGQISGFDPPRFAAFIQDMTLRHQSVAAIERERERANRYLEAAQTMLIGIDIHRRVAMLNRKACEVLQCTESELLGGDWFERVIPPEHRQAASFMFQALIEGTPRRAHYFECPIKTSQGEQRLIAWRAMAVEDADGAVTEVLWSGDDVTEARRAENELREAHQRITQVSRLATVGEMASGISHELNQPLAAIANFAQASSRLLSLPDPELEEVREALRQIAEQALRAGQIIHRFRNLVRYRKLTLELCALNDIVSEIEPLTHADARASGMRVELQLEPRLPQIRADRLQIQQVLLNLLRNSLDAMQALPPVQRAVTISTGLSREGNLQLIVADNGPGVPDDMRERLFMPFATSKEQGTGLGLVISRSIVEAHQGRLEYLPNRPSGARFVVTLPAELAPQNPGPPPHGILHTAR